MSNLVPSTPVTFNGWRVHQDDPDSFVSTKGSAVAVSDFFALADAVKVLTEKVDDLSGQLDALKEAVGRTYERTKSDG